MKDRIALFITGLFQVTFVAMNTVFISQGRVLPMLITGFMISYIWTFNVKKVAFGDTKDRIFYSSGAVTGTGLGYWISTTLIKVL